jgi:hypothetical protein
LKSSSCSPSAITRGWFSWISVWRPLLGYKIAHYFVELKRRFKISGLNICSNVAHYLVESEGRDFKIGVYKLLGHTHDFLVD